MNPQDLDRLFDESTHRVDKKSAPLSGAYGNSPLAADHLLLKRSWDYFRARMAMLEDHWKKILEAKDDKLKALLKELENEKKRTAEFLEENKSIETIHDEFKKSKMTDLVSFKKDIHSMRTQWENERESFMKTQSLMENRINELEEDIARHQKQNEINQAKWKEWSDSTKSQMAEQGEQARKRQELSLSETAKINDENQNLNVKIDLLRAEIERKNQALKEYQETASVSDREKNQMVIKLTDLNDQLRKKNEELSLHLERYQILEREKEALREGWSREQSEWRELWDRQRELSDKKRADQNEDVDMK